MEKKKFIITIARQFGSMGRPIAKRMSEKLGIEFYDRDIVEEAAKKLNLPVIVSLNTLMVDGTGMCGACRVTVGGKVRFACVEGPEFDGWQVDFDEAMRRQRMYNTEEKEAAEHHVCRIGRGK